MLPLLISTAFGLEFSPCHPKGLGMQVNCATLSVVVQEEKIEIPLIHIPAVKNTNRPPIFLLAGGPGQAATEIAPMAFQKMHTLHTHHDLLFLDQRGTGESGLSCSNDVQEDSLQKEEHNNHNDLEQFSATAEQQLKELQDCVDTLDFDVSDYSTANAANDIEEVRKAMGFESIALYGISYGTVLAQTYAYNYPEQVAGLILDGVVDIHQPMGEHVEEDANITWNAVLERCDQDPRCAKLNPRQSFQDIWENLPQDITIRHPRTYAKESITIQRDGFLSLLRMLLYSTETMELLPLALKQASEDDWGHLIALSTQGGDMGVSMALNLSIFCSESLPFWQFEDVVHPLQEPMLNPIQNPFSHQVRPMMKKMCGVWPHYDFQPLAAPSSKSDVPVLLFHGELDPITPPTRSRSLLEQYSQVHDIVVPNKGHNVALTDCGTNMMVDFLQKYNGTASVELIDCHQERPLRFFHTVAGHLSQESTEVKTEVENTEREDAEEEEAMKNSMETTEEKRTP